MIVPRRAFVRRECAGISDHETFRQFGVLAKLDCPD
jgi:hypothetical protein